MRKIISLFFASLLIVSLIHVLPAPRAQETKKSKTKDEAASRYKKWLEEDVVYIITSEERGVFQKLATDEERENFIEQFWVRRNPDPTGATNAFKEEHYSRIAYANDHFKSGIPGWATDRGRVYIMFGKPNQREAFPSGGSYERPISEGGGWTTTYPWERWFYGNPGGLGKELEIEFVDPTLSGEYRIALRKSEKDALFNSEGSGNTIAEDMGVVTRADRLRSDILMRPLGNNDSMFMDISQTPFSQIEKYFQLKHPPQIRFDDLRAAVNSHIYYDQLPFNLRADWSRVNSGATLVALTLSLSTGEMTALAARQQSSSVSLNVYGRVSALSGKVLTEFDDEMVLYHAAELSPLGVYQRKFPLPPGRYKLTVILRDKNSSKMGSKEILLLLPGSEVEQFEISPVVLADAAKPADIADTISEGFTTWSGWKVYPSPENRFKTEKPLYCYFEIYGFKVDAASRRPQVDVAYSISKDQQVLRQSPKSFAEQASNFLRDRIAVLAALPLNGLDSGRYKLDFEARDQITGRTNKVSVSIDIVR